MLPENCTTIVQGLGNVGSITARLLAEAGYKVSGLSDIHGGVHNPDGIDVQEALRYSRKHGKIAGLPGTREVTNAELLQMPCDVLVPAALENQLVEGNANLIQARLIVEAANGPTSPEAERVLEKRGIVVVPDILANAGGVTVSYLEWVQNRQGLAWTEHDINTRLQSMMTSSFSAVYEKAQQQQTTLRMAAYMLAIQRVAEAVQLRGSC